MFLAASRRAALTAVCTFFAAIFATVRTDNSYFRHIHIDVFFGFGFLFHRAGIFVFATGAAHRTFAVFTAVSHTAA